jgi:hypothetical protein
MRNVNNALLNFKDVQCLNNIINSFKPEIKTQLDNINFLKSDYNIKVLVYPKINNVKGDFIISI